MTVELTKIGLTMREIIQLYWLNKAQDTPLNPKEFHDYFTKLMPQRPIVYDYIARIAKKMATNGDLELEQLKNKKYYRTTNSGKVKLQNLDDLYRGRFTEVLTVLNRMEEHLRTGQTNPDDVEPLPAEYRAFFAKLISVKDISRYMIFSLGQAREEFYIGQVDEYLQANFGWSPSNAYLYDIAREMEAEGTLKGYWKEPEKRTIRLIKVTEDGAVFARQIKQDLTEQVKGYQMLLKSILQFLH